MHDIPKNRKTSTKESGHINGSNVALPRRHTAWIHWHFKFRQLVTCYPFSNADKNLEGIQPVASITHTTHGLRMSQLKKALALGHAQAETSVQHKRSAEKNEEVRVASRSHIHEILGFEPLLCKLYESAFNTQTISGFQKGCP